MNSVESKVETQYNERAQVYDKRWNRYTTQTLSFFKDWAEISASADILDVACGTGELERLLLEDNPEQTISGIDISEKMLVQAQQKLKLTVR